MITWLCSKLPGLDVEIFMRSLELYLRSAAVEVDRNVFAQKQGIYIGSPLAPLLSEFFSAGLDRVVVSKVQSVVPNSVVIKRYVYDFSHLRV